MQDAQPSRTAQRVAVLQESDARERYAEDRLAAAVLQRGVRPYVDHPATQQWKRTRLSEANIAIPDQMTFAAFDFETQSRDVRLQAQSAGHLLSCQV
jgi:O-methyltransferase involved in polyketide biosynthesis